MKKKPVEGQEVIVARYDDQTRTEHAATVLQLLRVQFVYRTQGGVEGYMLYESTDWRFPQPVKKRKK